MEAVIRIPLSNDPHPDTGLFCSKDDNEETMRGRISHHVLALISEGKLAFTIEGKHECSSFSLLRSGYTRCTDCGEEWFWDSDEQKWHSAYEEEEE